MDVINRENSYMKLIPQEESIYGRKVKGEENNGKTCTDTVGATTLTQQINMMTAQGKELEMRAVRKKTGEEPNVGELVDPNMVSLTKKRDKIERQEYAKEEVKRNAQRVERERAEIEAENSEKIRASARREKDLAIHEFTESLAAATKRGQT